MIGAAPGHMLAPELGRLLQPGAWWRSQLLRMGTVHDLRWLALCSWLQVGRALRDVAGTLCTLLCWGFQVEVFLDQEGVRWGASHVGGYYHYLKVRCSEAPRVLCRFIPCGSVLAVACCVLHAAGAERHAVPCRAVPRCAGT